MGLVTYTPNNQWWDIAGATPLLLPSGQNDIWTFDNIILSTSSTNPTGYEQNGFAGKVLDNLTFLRGIVQPSGVTVAQEMRIINKLVWNDTAASSSAHFNNQSGTGTTGTIPAVFSRSVSITDWWWFALEGLPHGAKLGSVIISTLGAGSDPWGSITPPTYQIIKYQRNAAETTLSTATNDAHASGNWTTTVVDTTIAATGSPTIDRAYKYALVCTAPKFTVTSSGVEVRGLAVTLA